MTRVADDVLGKVARQQADVFNRIRTGGLSPDRFYRVIKQLLNNLLVRVIAGHAWADALEAGGYDGIYINSKFTDEDLPPLPAAEAETEIRLRQQDETTTTQQWQDKLDNDPESKDKFAHPLQVLAIGYDENTMDEQRDEGIFTVWVSPRTGLLWCLVLSGGSDDRNLHVRRDSSADEWSGYYRAAVVAK